MPASEAQAPTQEARQPWLVWGEWGEGSRKGGLGEPLSQYCPVGRVLLPQLCPLTPSCLLPPPLAHPPHPSPSATACLGHLLSLLLGSWHRETTLTLGGAQEGPDAKSNTVIGTSGCFSRESAEAARCCHFCGLGVFSVVLGVIQTVAVESFRKPFCFDLTLLLASSFLCL